jgi:hypothetical protein
MEALVGRWPTCYPTKPMHWPLQWWSGRLGLCGTLLNGIYSLLNASSCHHAPLRELLYNWHPLDALVNKRNPQVKWPDSFIMSKLFILRGGREEKDITFFYGKTTSLGWDPEQWWLVEGYRFLNYNMKFGKHHVINMILDTTRVANKWQGYLHGNYGLTSHKCGSPPSSEKKLPLCGSFGTKQLLSMNERDGLLSPLYTMCFLPS